MQPDIVQLFRKWDWSGVRASVADILELDIGKFPFKFCWNLASFVKYWSKVGAKIDIHLHSE